MSTEIFFIIIIIIIFKGSELMQYQKLAVFISLNQNRGAHPYKVAIEAKNLHFAVTKV